MKITKFFRFILIIQICLSVSNVIAQPVITRMTCEHLSDPIGIDATHPRLAWQIWDDAKGTMQTAYELFVSIDSANILKATTWKTGKITKANNLIIYNGATLQPFTKYYWIVRSYLNNKQACITSPVASFETGMMDQANWKGAWISDGIDINQKAAPAFRKSFTTNKKIKTARAYIAVAGLCELYINGKRIGDHRLDPMYTRFDRRNLYVTYDVTSQLQQGENAIGVLLGNGWYNHQSTAVWYFHKAPWRGRPTFCMDLRIQYEDGTTETIITGKDWKTTLSPIIFNSIYTAEHYDARLEKVGWNNIRFNEDGWKNVIYRAAPSTLITAQALPPIRDVEQIAAVHFTRFSDTNYLYDLGRNIAGVSQLTVKGDSGTVIRLVHAEQVNKAGHADQSNINVHYRPTDNTDPFQTDIFILSGKGEETFKPRFNYKGFQYVEILSSKPVTLTKENLTGYFMHSNVQPAGTITASNKMIEQLWNATNNSYLSNLYGYPTDCPQREKNGWTGDAHIASETGLYNFDGITVYEKWLNDHKDEQQPNGVLPSIIPSDGWGYEWGNGPDWTSTIAIIPWNVYLFYGDTTLLSRMYDNIKRYVDYIASISPSGLTTWGLGDWVPVKSKTPVEFTSTVYYYTDVMILAKAAALLHKTTDQSFYTALAQKIKTAFNAKYLDKNTAIYAEGNQTELSTALYWKLVPEEMIPRIAANLAKRVAQDNDHLDVGLLGTKSLLNALSENGYADVAYKIAAQETFPSWGWWIKNGATTLYENWPIDAKSDISRNHIMFGEIGAWLYKGLGGIYPDEQQPGFKQIQLRPNFVNGLDSFTATHEGPYGNIVSSWKKKNETILYHVVVPANSTALLTLPAQKIISENGQLLKNTSTGSPANDGNKRAHTYILKPGSYFFEIK